MVGDRIYAKVTVTFVEVIRHITNVMAIADWITRRVGRLHRRSRGGARHGRFVALVSERGTLVGC